MIDVIVPVFDGAAHVRRCLGSVRDANCSTAYQLVVIDDCSPDPELSEWLQQCADQGHCILLTNPRNLGFVASVNRALQLHPDRDVVLLNSDTEVSGNWLDRLVRCARSAPDIATATPFSNNGTICSYPFDGWSEGVPGGLGLEQLDQIFAQELRDEVVDLPTGVGFCMYVSRASLSDCGGLDEDAFGRGYGEENDFCLRAAKAGWRNVLCADLFVFHAGGVSFGSERQTLMNRASERLLDLHPDYHEWLREFLARDPLSALRSRIDAARCERSGAELSRVMDERAQSGRLTAHALQAPRPAILHILHGWGGGAKRWIEDFACGDPRFRSLILCSMPEQSAVGSGLCLVDPVLDSEPLLSWSLDCAIKDTALEHPSVQQVLGQVISAFDVQAVIVSSLVGHSLDVLRTGLPTSLVLHDLYPVCPALFGWFGEQCRKCDAPRLASCLSSNPYNLFWHRSDADRWLDLRKILQTEILQREIKVVAPTRSAAQRLLALVPSLASSCQVIEHGVCADLSAPSMAEASEARSTRSSLRVLVTGRLDEHKGLRLLSEFVGELSSFAEVLLLGSGDAGLDFAHIDGVCVIKNYRHDELAGHVRAFEPDCALLLSVVPESFGYTLSEMRSLQIPVVATNLGAYAERIVDGLDGFLVEPDAGSVIARLRSFENDRSVLQSVRRNLSLVVVRSREEMVSDHHALLGLPAQAPQVSSEPARELLYRFLEQTALLKKVQRRNDRLQQDGLEHARADTVAARQQLATIEHELREARTSIATLEKRLESLNQKISVAAQSLVKRLRNVVRPESFAQMDMPADDSANGEVLAQPATLTLLGGDPVVRHLGPVIASGLGMSWDMLPLVPVDGDYQARKASEFSHASLLRSGLSGIAQGGLTHQARFAWFAGLPLAADPRSDEIDWPVEDMQTILMPAECACAAFRHHFPEVRVRTEVLDFPLAGRWTAELTEPICRGSKRRALALPDAKKLIFGMGRTDTDRGFDRFAHIADAVTRHSNIHAFVWLSEGNELWLEPNRPWIGPLVSSGKLFLLEWERFEPWLFAVDLYLGTCRAGVYDAAAVEAVAAGLPALVLDSSSLPDDFEHCEILAGECDDDWAKIGAQVVAMCDAYPVNREQLDLRAQTVRSRFGGEAAMERFVTACRSAYQLE